MCLYLESGRGVGVHTEVIIPRAELRGGDGDDRMGRVYLGRVKAPAPWKEEENTLHQGTFSPGLDIL